MKLQFQPFAEKMRAESLPEEAIHAFQSHFEKLIKEETGLIRETDILPVDDLPDVFSLTAGGQKKTGQRHLHKTVSIKLNGGLGTGMGMNGPKGLLEVKPDLSFLDIVVSQNRCMDPSIPVVFMNSFSTSRATRRALKRYSWLHNRSVDLEFLQYKVPKVDVETLEPAQHPENPSLEWCPPGHGNVYAALYTSGMLKKLLDNGYEYAFVSNIDNLGAVVDPAILGYFIENRFNFMMEASQRTSRDKKGGHLAKKRSGGYVLREIAQCPEEDLKEFQNIRKHRFFNTNNIWVYLPALQTILDRENGVMDLPMIRNLKTLDPRDPDSPEVYQLESAMGSAVSVFGRAGAVCVPKYRFIPVKNTNDLLEVRSDRYVLTERFHLMPNPENTSDRISIDLDSACYKFIDDFENRFPRGAPSLKKCTHLIVKGDFTFGKHVTVTDDAILINKTKDRFDIDDNQILGQYASLVTDVDHRKSRAAV
jgi:UTP--glucose-1-phosphate uridylyltransferase